MSIERWFEENCVTQYPVQVYNAVVLVDAETPEEAQQLVQDRLDAAGVERHSYHPFQVLDPQFRMK